MLHHAPNEDRRFPRLTLCGAKFGYGDLIRLRIVSSLRLDRDSCLPHLEIVSRLVSSPGLYHVEGLFDPAECFLDERLKINSLGRDQGIDGLVNSDESSEGYAKVVRENSVLFARQGEGILTKQIRKCKAPIYF